MSVFDNTKADLKHQEKQVALVVGDALNAKVEELAKLHPVEFDRRLNEEAEKLNCRAATLDALVKKQRHGDAGLQGEDIKIPDVEPWGEPVDGDALFCEIADTCSSYVVLPEHADTVLALWTAHCHTYQAFTCTPRLNVTSPQKQCGKTLLLDVLSSLVPRALPTENMTTPVFFRAVAQFEPTFLADEYDTYFRHNEDLRGALNAGHRRGGQVLRVEGDAREIRAFTVFAPVAFGGIRELPETLQDRSIILRLKRATKAEIDKKGRFDIRKTKAEQELCRKLARWGQDNFDALAAADPDMGDLHNRQADNWRPLYAIADVVGGDWPNAIREAMKALTIADDDQSIVNMLLADTQDIFNDRAERKLPYADRIKSVDLASALHKIEGRPWAEYGRQSKPISPNQIARLFHRHHIVSGSTRFGKDDNAKGYKLSAFEDDFDRYLSDPPSTNGTTSQASDHAGSSDFQNVTPDPDVTDRNRLKASNHGGCDVVTDENRGGGENKGKATAEDPDLEEGVV